MVDAGCATFMQSDLALPADSWQGLRRKLLYRWQPASNHSKAQHEDSSSAIPGVALAELCSVKVVSFSVNSCDLMSVPASSVLEGMTVDILSLIASATMQCGHKSKRSKHTQPSVKRTVLGIPVQSA